MISIVIPLYNKNISISRTIKSVLDQDYKDFELIIVNDGSTDNSAEIVRSFNDERLILVDKKNGGVSSARNEGIYKAKFQLVAFLDADDYWYPNHLSELLYLFKNYGETCDGFVTKFIKSKCNTVKIKVEEKRSYCINNYFKAAYSPNTILSSSNFAIKKDVAIENGLYDTSINYGEDVEFWYRFFKHRKLAVSNITTAIYFTDTENRSDARFIPLHKRFSQYEFKNKSFDEKKYLGKLVCLLILDYLMLKSYKTVLNVVFKYFFYLHYSLCYFLLLVKKYIKKNIDIR